jgi:hypothetical protein
MIFYISPSKLGTISDMIKSAFQIPHHVVAIRIFVYAPPRCFSAEKYGAGGDGFPHGAEKR